MTINVIHVCRYESRALHVQRLDQLKSTTSYSFSVYLNAQTAGCLTADYLLGK